MWLALSLFASVDVPHAALHPHGADLYVEVPDVGAAIAAYANAPAIHLVSSEGAANVADLAKDLGFDLRSVAGSLLPVADPSRPDDRWWPWSAARKASMSLSGIEAGPKTGGATNEMGAWLIVDFSNSDAAQQAERALVAMGGKEAKPVGELAVGTTTTPVLEIGSPFDAITTNAWLARLDTRIVLGAGAAPAADYAKRSASADGGLAASWNAVAAEKVLGAPTGVTIADLYADLDDLPAFAAENALLSQAALFVAPFLSAHGRWRIELSGDRFVTNAVYEPRGKARALADAFGKRPVPASALQFVPPDAIGSWITDVDAASAESAITTLFGSILDGATIAPPAAGEPRMADGLKSSMAASLLPIQSLMSPTPRVVLAIELADAAKFQAGLDGWLARAQTAIPDLTIERKPYRKVPTITVGRGKDEGEAGAGGGGGSPFGGMSLEPTRMSIAILGDRVVFTSAPSVARNEIKRVQDAADVGVHAATKNVSRPAEAIEVSTMDWSSYLGKAWDGVRGFAPMLAQNTGKPIDVEKLPTAAQLFAPFRSSTSWSRRVDGRIYTHAESSFGPETPIGIAAFGFLAMRAQQMPRGPAPANGGESTPPSAEGSSGDAPTEADVQRTSTLSALREVRTAVAVYRSQFNRVPATAADLLQKTDVFPDGFLKGGVVPADGWGRALVYAAKPDGATYELRSTGPDGVDQQGAGDDVRLP